MNYIIKNASIVNEGAIINADLLIKEGRIEKIASSVETKYAVTEIDASGKYLLPGCIDEPGAFSGTRSYAQSNHLYRSGEPQ